jgi:hypothetical protein
VGWQSGAAPEVILDRRRILQPKDEEVSGVDFMKPFRPKFTDET